MKDIQPVDAIMEKDIFLRVGIANSRDRNKQYKDFFLFENWRSWQYHDYLRNTAGVARFFTIQDIKHIT